MTVFAVSIMLMTTIQWIMLDMYLPALPSLRAELGASEALLNVSLNAGIVMTAVGIIFCGPLSDRFGRKPVLLLGIAVSGLSALACGFSHGIVFLSVMRGINGLGSGAATSTATAIIRDSYDGQRFEKTMTILQSVAVIGPIIAPTLGALIIDASSWRYIFVFLAVATGISMLPLLFFSETRPSDEVGAATIRELASVSASVLRDRAFLLFLGIIALLMIPLWGYLAVSSYVFIEFFGLPNVTYGLLYGVAATISCISPFLYLLLLRWFPRGRIVVIIIVALVATGVFLLLFGSAGPILYLIGILPIMIAEGVIRPLGLVALLEERHEAVGTVTSLIQFTTNIVGIIGTTLATLPWPNLIIGTGVLSVGCGLVGAVLLLMMYRQRLMQKQLW